MGTLAALQSYVSNNEARQRLRETHPYSEYKKMRKWAFSALNKEDLHAYHFVRNLTPRALTIKPNPAFDTKQITNTIPLRMQNILP